MFGYSGIGFPYEKKYTISIHMGKHQYFWGPWSIWARNCVTRFHQRKK